MVLVNIDVYLSSKNYSFISMKNIATLLPYLPTWFGLGKTKIVCVCFEKCTFGRVWQGLRAEQLHLICLPVTCLALTRILPDDPITLHPVRYLSPDTTVVNTQSRPTMFV